MGAGNGGDIYIENTAVAKRARKAGARLQILDLTFIAPVADHVGERGGWANEEASSHEQRTGCSLAPHLEGARATGGECSLYPARIWLLLAEARMI